MDLDENPVGTSRKNARLILINVCVGQFIVGLDQRALLVALPTLSHIFNPKNSDSCGENSVSA
jgi:hypothetical protein